MAGPARQRDTRARRARRHAAARSAGNGRRATSTRPGRSSRAVLRRASTSSPRRCRVTRARISAGQAHAACDAGTGTLQVKPGPIAVMHGAARQACLDAAAPARTARSAPTCCRSRRQHVALMVERALVQLQRRLQRGDHLGAAGMAGEAIDRRAARRPCRARMPSTAGRDILLGEGRNGAVEDHAEPGRVDVPAHDVERVGPHMLARALDARDAALAGAARRRPPRRRRTARSPRCWPWSAGRARKASGADLDRDQQHGRARARRAPGGWRSRGPVTPPAQPSPKTGTALDVVAEAHASPRPAPRGWAWRCRSRRR